MPSVRRPWVTWTDGILVVLIVSANITISWLSYRDGRYFEGWIWHVISFWPFIVGLAILLHGGLLLRPWLRKKTERQCCQVWVRPALLLAAWLCVAGVWKLKLFNVPGVTSFLSGCLDAVRHTVSQDDIEELRQMAAERVRKGNTSEDFLRLSVEQLPPSFHQCSWGEPRLEPLHPHRRGVEIEVFWGGTLPGWFGLKIDPEVLPVEGITEPSEGAFRWHYKLYEGVYFFHTNG